MSISEGGFKFPTASIRSKYFAENGSPDVIKWGVIDVIDREKIALIFESISSPYRQGVWLRCDGGFEIDGSIYPQVTVWSDTAPPKIELICRTKDGRLHLYNVWDEGRGRESQTWRSGMKVEMLNDGYRYHCTDAGHEINFDTLVFKIIRKRLKAGS